MPPQMKESAVKLIGEALPGPTAGRCTFEGSLYNNVPMLQYYNVPILNVYFYYIFVMLSNIVWIILYPY